VLVHLTHTVDQPLSTVTPHDLPALAHDLLRFGGYTWVRLRLPSVEVLGPHVVHGAVIVVLPRVHSGDADTSEQLVQRVSAELISNKPERTSHRVSLPRVRSLLTGRTLLFSRPSVNSAGQRAFDLGISTQAKGRRPSPNGFFGPPEAFLTTSIP
jgi:hypothetical protein